MPTVCVLCTVTRGPRVAGERWFAVPYLVASVVFVGVLCLLDLILTFGVIRRLREHTERLSLLATEQSAMDSVMQGAGTEVGDFAAETLSGDQISRADLAGDMLVAFFTPQCPACSERLPDFITRAKNMPGGRDRVLAIVVGSPTEVRDLCDRLAPVAQVVRDSDAGPVTQAFGVQGYPAFALLRDGVVQASHHTLDPLPEAVGA